MSILGIRIANLLLFALSCFLVANIINQVGAFSLIPVDRPALRPAMPSTDSARPWSKHQQILDRNLFGAQVIEEEIIPEPEPEEQLTKTRWLWGWTPPPASSSSIRASGTGGSG